MNAPKKVWIDRASRIADVLAATDDTGQTIDDLQAATGRKKQQSITTFLMGMCREGLLFSCRSAATPGEHARRWYFKTSAALEAFETQRKAEQEVVLKEKIRRMEARRCEKKKADRAPAIALRKQQRAEATVQRQAAREAQKAADKLARKAARAAKPKPKPISEAAAANKIAKRLGRPPNKKDAAVTQNQDLRRKMDEDKAERRAANWTGYELTDEDRAKIVRTEAPPNLGNRFYTDPASVPSIFRSIPLGALAVAA